MSAISAQQSPQASERFLRLDAETIYQAVQFAAHISIFTRQGRKGQLSSWKAYAPGLVGRNAITAIDRAMRGETGPSPVWEGDYGIMAILLDGENASYDVRFPRRPRAQTRHPLHLHQGAFRRLSRQRPDRSGQERSARASPISPRSRRSTSTPRPTPTWSWAPAAAIPKNTIPRRREKPWITPPCTSSPSPSKTVTGITRKATPKNENPAPKPWRFGKRSRTHESPGMEPPLRRRARSAQKSPGRQGGDHAQIRGDHRRRACRRQRPSARRNSVFGRPEYIKKADALFDGWVSSGERDRVFESDQSSTGPRHLTRSQALNPICRSRRHHPERAGRPRHLLNT